MIVKSAVWHEGHLLTGKRHSDCISVAAVLVKGGIGKFPIKGGENQGFLTDENKFLNRELSAIHAIDCGQIKELKFSLKTLFSEDLW